MPRLPLSQPLQRAMACQLGLLCWLAACSSPRRDVTPPPITTMGADRTTAADAGSTPSSEEATQLAPPASAPGPAPLPTASSTATGRAPYRSCRFQCTEDADCCRGEPGCPDRSPNRFRCDTTSGMCEELGCLEGECGPDQLCVDRGSLFDPPRCEPRCTDDPAVCCDILGYGREQCPDSHPNIPFCDATQHCQFRGCMVDSECPEPNQACVNGDCTDRCTEDLDCSAQSRRRGTVGTCREGRCSTRLIPPNPSAVPSPCTADSCGEGLYCGPNQRCIQCLDDSECAGNDIAPRCFPEQNSCGCNDDSDCPALHRCL